MNANAPAKAPRHPDSALIESLGGAAELARKLGYGPRSGAAQRVQNWKYRGIPEVIRLRRPDIFGPAPTPKGEAAA
ncbi:hypothetical protein EA660_18210 [Pseudoxanthomonas winnipegensis]|uniref:Helix-turn-helix domain-containing protein n=1 Tax=Pseudoxanthomonas winnipegensis TaxID=2480810 RepID=A0A4Q8L4M1_9GAMM|nr:hypothetical protein EA660_18210 [Pseudoxanthomonas winnipegensis]